jgi:hypothetical protein
LVAIGLALVVATTSIEDVLGPMEASKPEFLFKFNWPFVGVAAALAVWGIVIFARSWSQNEELCVP